MKPYYHDELSGITIYHGDCREVLPLPAAVVLTDPPYGLGDRWSGGAGGASSWRIPASEQRTWDSQPINDVVEPLAEHDGDVVIWGGNYYDLPPSRCWLVWDKKQADTWTTGQAELAWTNLDRTVRVFRYAQCEVANEGFKYHPSQKPLRLLTWCLKWLGDGLVLDPFCGSGSTLVAAKSVGRSAIGIEIEERYCEIAANRLAQGVLFGVEPRSGDVETSPLLEPGPGT